MKRVYVEIGRGMPMHNFTDWRLPRDIDLYLKDATVIGEGYEQYDIKPNEVITINEQEYIHVASRKYFTKNTHGKLGAICELTLLQPMLYEENHDENA